MTEYRCPCRVSNESEEYHQIDEYSSRHFPTMVEIYCSMSDEKVVLMKSYYITHCPMCGDGIDV